MWKSFKNFRFISVIVTLTLYSTLSGHVLLAYYAANMSHDQERLTTWYDIITPDIRCRSYQIVGLEV